MARCPTLQALLPTVQKISNCNFLDVAELHKDTEALREWVNEQVTWKWPAIYVHLQQTKIAKDSHKVVPLGVNKDEFVIDNEDSIGDDDDEDTEHDEMEESGSELLHLPDEPYSSSDETLW